MRGTIRVGVLLDSLDVPAWQFDALEAIANCDCARISLVIVRGRGHPEAATSRRSFTQELYGFIRRLEAGKKRPEPDACRLVSAEGLLGHATREQRDEIDVLILFADPATTTAPLPQASLGHWFLTSSGRPFAPSGGALVGFEELVRLQGSLESTLVVRDPDSGRSRIAYSSRSAIDRLSHFVTRNEHLWKCSTFFLRALRRCHAAGGLEYLSSLPIAIERRRDVASGLMLIPALVCYLLWRIWRKAYRHLFVERWVLMAAVDESVAGEGPYTTLVPPRDRFWADPHVVEHDGRYHVFFEDASRATGVGHISVMSGDSQGRFDAPQCILRRPYHLSYPFVFRWNGTWYLLPESGQNRTVELYRSVRFPDAWEPAHVLLRDVEAYDSTLVEHGGRWWLFANVRAKPGTSTWDELHIFHADSPISAEWRAHAANPVVSDVCRARPAGRFYVNDGRLYRPSQDSSRRYGRALVINEVIELNDSRYEERTVKVIGPRGHRGVNAMHSYSRAGRLTLIDAIRREPRTAESQSR